ncbi:hypothetical protein [Raineyella fluvialis]|uniref:Membrane-associated oxidoreductase n=1 Tax=Raineyella fluvialis TaxID=2662261 RepID=A0A5Q2F9N8_9ACTN|nr:hypothetical protein [Raineyella fluvialis]QGF23519.1 hypothetical protein Rai3103_07400 [Raineyella fluvialis]
MAGGVGVRAEADWVSLLLERAGTGDTLRLPAFGTGGDPDAALADAWPVECLLPADQLRTALIALVRTKDAQDPRGLRIVGADILGRLDLDHLDLPLPFRLDHCRLRAGVTAVNATLADLSLRGSVFTTAPSPGWAPPAVDLRGASITGELGMTGAVVTGRGEDALVLDGATIGGAAFLDRGFCAVGQVRAHGATVRGQLNMTGAALTALGGDALVLDRASIGGGVFLDRGFRATGTVRAHGMTSSGELNMTGAALTALGGDALVLDRASIGGGVFLDRGFRTKGRVRAHGAMIAGQLNMSGATLAGAGDALVLDGATIGSGVFLDAGFRASGQVRLHTTTIAGQLNMSGATLTGGGRDALVLDRVSIGGGVFLDAGFRATGQVRAIGAKITGQLALTGATLTRPGGTALNLQGAEVNELWLRGLSGVSGAVDLNACDIGELVLDPGGGLLPGGGLIADGWQVRSLSGEIAGRADLAQKWLDTRPGHVAYSPQPARVLAAVYEEAGQPDQARRLRYTAARKLTAQAPWWAKPGLWAYGLLVGHGYYPLLTLPWLLAALALTFGVATTQRAAFIPTDPGKATAAVAAVDASSPEAPSPAPVVVTGAMDCTTLGTYPCFDPGSIALQTVVPPAAAIETTAWRPTGWVVVALTVAKSAGWILSVLFLAGITGLLRRT